MKGDGGKQQQQKGTGFGSEAEVLFPRLHVSEAEKAGPRAPPRNKMALYEQLTVPSHRFVPPSPPVPSPGHHTVVAPFSQQYFPNECQYSYPPYYTGSGMTYAAVNIAGHSFGQSSLGVSNSSATVDGGGETWRVTGTESGTRSTLAVRATSMQEGSGSHKILSGKRGGGGGGNDNEGDDLVASAFYTERVNDNDNGGNDLGVSASFTEKGSIRLLEKPNLLTSENSQQLCGKSCINIEREPAVVQSSSMLDHLQYPSGLCHARTEHPDMVAESCVDVERPGKLSVERECRQPIKEAGFPCDFKSGDGYNEDWSATSQGHSSQHSGSIDVDCPLEQTPSSHHPRRPVDGVGIMCDVIEHGEMAAYPLNGMQSLQKNCSSVELSAAEASCSPLGELASGRLVKPVDLLMEDKLRSNACSPNDIGDVSKPSQVGDGSDCDDSNSSILDSISAPNIEPKYVMKAIGQQQFWKARRAILRQQRIFSSQVFELHKLVQVQQMLAATPLEDGLDYDSPPMTPGDDADVPVGSQDKAQGKSEDRELQYSEVHPTKETSNFPIEDEIQQGVTCYPSWYGHDGPQRLNYDPDGHMYLGPYPSMPAVLPSGIGQWGFAHPSMGTNQWFGPTTVQPGAFLYQPFATGFPPTAGYAGSYGSITGPGPLPLASFGLPGCDPRPVLSHDVYSRVCPVSTDQPWQPALCYNPAVAPVGLDSSASQYAMQHTETMRRVYDPGFRGEGPSGSITSYTNQPEKSVNMLKAPLSFTDDIAFQSKWMNHIPGQAPSNGFCRPSYQAEKLALSTGVRSNNGLILSPNSDAVEHQVEQPWDKGQDSKENNQSCYIDCYAHHVSKRDSKRHKEGQREFVSHNVLDEGVANIEDLTDQSQNALCLFPLAPVLNFRDCNRNKSAGPEAECQNRVIKAIPHAAVVASKSAAGILLSIQQERRQ
eukprot:c27814_g1_i1 orf=278-3088(+)